MNYSNIQFSKVYGKPIFYLACFLPIIFIIYYILGQGLPAGHDYNAHMLRLISLNNEIKNGQFPYVFDYWDQYGIGYSWQIFYPPFTNLYLFISAYFFHFLDEIWQMKLVLLQINIVNFLCAFYAAKKQYKSNLAGLFCAAILFSSYYYLTMIFARFSLADLSAVGFIILFIRGLNSLITDSHDKLLIPIVAPIILLCSIPMTIATIFFCLIYFVFFFKKIFRIDIILFLIKSIFICCLISSIYVLPLYYNIKHKDIFMASNAVISYKNFLGISFSNLLLGKGLYPLSLGLFYNIEIIRQTLLHWRANKNHFFILATLIISCSFIFPWWIIPDEFTFFNIMQFPWRVLSIAICFMALWLCKLVLEKKYIYGSLLIILSLITNPLNSDNITIIKDKKVNTEVVYKDYCNNNMLKENQTPIYEPLFNNPFQNNNSDYIIRSKTFENGFPKYIVETNKATIVSLPLIYYHSVKVKVNEATLNPIYMNDGSIGIELEAGLHSIKIGYDTSYNLYGLLLCLLGILLIIWEGLKLKRFKVNK